MLPKICYVFLTMMYNRIDAVKYFTRSFGDLSVLLALVLSNYALPPCSLPFSKPEEKNNPCRAACTGNYITTMFIVLLEAEVEFHLVHAELVVNYLFKTCNLCQRDLRLWLVTHTQQSKHIKQSKYHSKYIQCLE